MALATYLADKSAYARLHIPAVFDQLAPLIDRGLVATCSLVDLEVLFSTRSPQEYDDVAAERAGLERLDIEQVDWDRALTVQRHFAGPHRSARWETGARSRRGGGEAASLRAALRPRLRPRRGCHPPDGHLGHPSRLGPLL